MRSFFPIHVLPLLLFGLASTTTAQIDARMFRYPDISETQIAFVYAGDIWVVDKMGGTAKRLSSPAGEELLPRFAPDGSKIAFSGNYDGNVDVYVVPAGGGTPKRITYHPDGDRLLDWTPDGDGLLFASSRKSGRQRYNQIYRIAAGGGPAERLPVPYGEFGALSPDGTTLVYTPKTRAFRTWKRYRGGTAPEIWSFDLTSYDARNLSESAANDEFPMWHGRSVYFLSDRGPELRYNLWRYDLDDASFHQITRFTEFDVSWPAIGPSDIVFQAGGALYRLDLDSEQYSEVDVAVVTDRSTLRPRTENVGRMITGAHISPSGTRAVFEARGQLFTVPKEHGPVLQVTHSSGAAERYPAWSPDGRRIAFFSDRTGEYELTVRPADGTGTEQTLTDLGPGYRYTPFWSPDNRKIAFIDQTLTIRIYDLDSGDLTEVDRARDLLHGALQAFEVSWSNDSRWLAYARSLENQQSAIFLYDTRSGRPRQVTSGYYSDADPVFDPDGRYLYYVTDRHLDPIYSDLQPTWIYPNAEQLVAVPLRTDVASPLAPRNDREGTDAGRDGRTDDGAAGDEGREGEDTSSVEIDLEGLEARGVLLPPRPGQYTGLRAVSGKLVYRRIPNKGAPDEASPILYYDLEEREEKTVLDDADFHELSADGKRLLVGKDRAWSILDLKPGQTMKDRLATDRLETEIDPRSEWRQVFTDVWRTYRDYFYDPSLHGLDWAALRDHYGALLDDAVTRWDVNYVIGELIGEVNASHTYVRGGDTETSKRRQVGLLGVDWSLEDGAYRIERIVRGAPWDIETRSPLAAPGLSVSEGEYVLAVNGAPLDTEREPYAAFEGLSEATVILTVNDRPGLDGAREVLVETLDWNTESRLRHLEWIESNRRRVEEATDGRIGYVYVPNTAISGQTELVRQLRGQVDRAGLIVDERFNSGGQLADRFIEMMNRQKVGYIYFRHAATTPWPPITLYGPKVMLINGWSGSGGDAFPWFFREMTGGTIIGERTWGGLIGPAVGHRTIDGGFYTAPPGRLYHTDGEWFAEGHGVDPDIPVVDDPERLARGRDPQLEAAIQEVLRLLEQNPPRFTRPPAFERRVPDSRAATNGRSPGSN